MSTVTAIVYTSATGFTRRYAQMLAERMGLPAYELGGPGAPGKGCCVVYLGWLCAGGIKGLKKALGRYDVRAVCAVGMAPATADYEAKLAKDNKVWDRPFFYLRGGYAPERLGGAYKLMMKPMAAAMAKAPQGDEDETQRAMREAFSKGGDWVSEQQLVPVLAELR